MTVANLGRLSLERLILKGSGGPGENRTPTFLRILDFLTTLVFTSRLPYQRSGVCGLDYALTVEDVFTTTLGPARLVSTPSEEISL